MVKHINVGFDDEEFALIEAVKNPMTWHAFIVTMSQYWVESRAITKAVVEASEKDDVQSAIELIDELSKRSCMFALAYLVSRVYHSTVRDHAREALSLEFDKLGFVP